MENLNPPLGYRSRYPAHELANEITDMRFSLREILLVIAIIAMAIPFYISTTSNKALRIENQALRDETSSITKREGLINLIAIPSASSYKQSWRVLLPENSKHVYKLAFAQSNIPPRRFGHFPDLQKSKKFTAALPSNMPMLGEFVLSVELDENAPRIYWRIHGLTESRFEFEPKNAGWVKADNSTVHNSPSGAVHVNGDGRTASVTPGEPLELLTARGRKTPDGVIVFIESQLDLD